MQLLKKSDAKAVLSMKEPVAKQVEEIDTKNKKIE